MIRKLTYIFVLALLFGAFLVIKPYFNKRAEPPTIEDRLPDADFMATLDMIRLAREVSGMLYYYKVPYRDFLSAEFILSQAKSNGLQLQNTTYLFANKNGEIGVLAELSDSTKLHSGLEKLRHFFKTKDYKVAKQKVIKLTDYNAYLFYGKKFICFYRGDNLSSVIDRVCNAKPNQVSPVWMDLLNQQKTLNRSVIMYSRLQDFQDMSLDQVMAYPIVDSTHVYFHTYISSKDTIPIKLKEGGFDFKPGEFTKVAANLHIDPSYLQNHQDHPVFRYLLKQSARIRFPMKEFLEMWGGDITFQQGGLVSVEEKFIESELDDEFNVTEVVKSREVKMPGFMVYYTGIKNPNTFVDKMIANGFMTQQDGKFHILLSPPLTILHKKDHSQAFYATKTLPKLVPSAGSNVMWMHKGTQYYISVDSVNTFEMFGKLSFSMEKILSTKNLKSLTE